MVYVVNCRFQNLAEQFTQWKGHSVESWYNNMCRLIFLVQFDETIWRRNMASFLGQNQPKSTCFFNGLLLLKLVQNHIQLIIGPVYCIRVGSQAFINCRVIKVGEHFLSVLGFWQNAAFATFIAFNHNKFMLFQFAF